ncbi:HalOD1 output domain-containing protein [Halovivax limisalsi]|uniref:HalOD1 output domain-containing protein n=1 Tax=Halovivax limisalsi TaxID=1453760 RepID=UPI001FFD2D64|nr:HalOD1 output domain-containing protein [Halovivax limisalsi]
MSAAPPNDCCATQDGPITLDRSTSQPSSEAVLEAVSSVTGRPAVPTEAGSPLPPLYHAIDPEALDQLVDHAAACQTDFSLSFEYASCEVTVSVDEIAIDPRPDAN